MLLLPTLACLGPRTPWTWASKTPHLPASPVRLSLLLPLILFPICEKRHVQRFLIRVCITVPMALGTPLGKFLIGFPGVYLQLPCTTVTLCSVSSLLSARRRHAPASEITALAPKLQIPTKQRQISFTIFSQCLPLLIVHIYTASRKNLIFQPVYPNNHTSPMLTGPKLEYH